MRKLSGVVRLVCVFLVVGAFLAPTSAGAQASDFSTLVGKWVWKQAATCATCPAFTAILTIASVSPDGGMSGTYQSPFQAPTGMPVRPRATITDGKIKVALKVGQVNFDLDYKKADDSLEGPVSGYPPRALIREANFHREK
jgi:hypothetical protein